jgi:TP901 family phage tail tape measure protein
MPGSTLGLGVRLTATDAMSGPVESASRSLGMLNQQALNTQQALGALQVRAGAVATGIGAGLTAAVGVSIAEAAELEDIMFLVQQKTGFADEVIREMSQDFLQLSASLPLSAQELARVGVIAGQLGIQTKEGIEALAFSSAQLARTSDLTEETAAAALARLSRLFDLPIEQADRLGSSLVRLANASTAEASSIVDITQRFAGLARVVGISVAQANAFSATLIDAGVSSEVAGSSMLEILGEMTSRTRAFGRQLGVSDRRFRQMINDDAAGTLVRFFESFRGMDKFQVKRRLDELGLSGIRVSTAVFGLSAQTDALRANLAASVQAFTESADLSRAFESQTRSLSARIDTFVGSLKNVAISIGDTLIPVVKFVVDLGTDLLGLFLELPRPVEMDPVSLDTR